jgi:L-ascorbate metabolism protein UlaG (beta-lactamase superfamily)
MPREFKITLIGGPTALVEIQGLRLLTDPTFDPPGDFPGAVTLTKSAGPALPPGQLGVVDAVLLSHDQHFDNLDRSGREYLNAVPRTFTTPGGAQRLRGTAIGLEPWQSATIGTTGWKVIATPARHGPAGIEPISGEVTGFVLSDPQGAPAIYLTGDTVWHDGTVEVAQRFQPTVVVVFAGGAQARGPFYLTMDTNDVVEAARYFPNAAIVPIHHHGWKHFTQSQQDLELTFKALKIEHRLHPINPGETITLPM